MKITTNILVECPEAIASVRVGVLEPLSAIKNCKVVFKNTISIRKEDIEWCDILITVRGYEYITLEIIKAAQKAGCYLIYFLDDDLLDIPKDLPNGRCFDNNSEDKKLMLDILKRCNLLWCVNPLIGKKYGKYCGGKWILTDIPIELKVPNKYSNEKIRILYAGSIDHTNSIQEYLSPVVRKLCDIYKEQVEFTFIGVNPKISEYKNVRYIKYINNYDMYKQIVSKGRFHIGIAIVKDEDFYKAKYYNKYLEYTSIGAVGIYTNSAPYSNIIINNENGLLCDNTFEGWFFALSTLIDNEDLRKNCFLNAKAEIESEFNHNKIGKDLQNLIPELAGYKVVNKKKVNIGNLRLAYYKYRVLQTIHYHRFIFPIILIYKLLKKICRKLAACLRRVVKGYD